MPDRLLKTLEKTNCQLLVLDTIAFRTAMQGTGIANHEDLNWIFNKNDTFSLLFTNQ